MKQAIINAIQAATDTLRTDEGMLLTLIFVLLHYHMLLPTDEIIGRALTGTIGGLLIAMKNRFTPPVRP